MGNRAAVRPQTARPRVARSQAAWPAARVGASWAAQRRPVGAAVAGTRVCGRRAPRPGPGYRGRTGHGASRGPQRAGRNPGCPRPGGASAASSALRCLPLWLEGFPRKRPRVTRASRSRVTPVCHALLPRTGPDVSLCAASRAPPGRGPGHRRRVGTEAARPDRHSCRSLASHASRGLSRVPAAHSLPPAVPRCGARVLPLP